MYVYMCIYIYIYIYIYICYTIYYMFYTYVICFILLHHHFELSAKSDVTNNRFGTLLPDVL